MTASRTAPMTLSSAGLAAAALAILLCSGCATGVSIEDAVPVSAEQRQEVPMGGGEVASQPAFSTPGDYPNLNVVPVPAAAQLTPAERQAEANRLRATRAAVASQPTDPQLARTNAELRRLGQTHAADVLKQIEGQ